MQLVHHVTQERPVTKRAISTVREKRIRPVIGWIIVAALCALTTWTAHRACTWCFGNDDPQINAPSNVDAGGKLIGEAWSDSPPITVTAKIDGATIGTDYGEGTSPINVFEFDVPSWASGKTITLTATNSQGQHNTVLVSVN